MVTPTPGMSIDNFLNIATSKQRVLVNDLWVKIQTASEREKQLWKEVEEYERRVRNHRGYKIGHEYKHMDLCDDASRIDRSMDAVRSEIGGYLQVLVDNGMTNLGIVQRHYQSYTGNELPK